MRYNGLLILLLEAAMLGVLISLVIVSYLTR